jgi:hypothetical protein
MAGLTQRLQELDTVWVVGGNAFVMARAMARAGFREALLNVADRAGSPTPATPRVPRPMVTVGAGRRLVARPSHLSARRQSRDLSWRKLVARKDQMQPTRPT